MADDQESAPALDSVRFHRAGVRAAVDELERVMAVAAHGRVNQWATGVTESLVRLRDAFEHHISVTEADNGLFAEVVQAAPRLAHRADQLRLEHVAIREAIAEALSALKNATAETVDDRREQMLLILGQIVRHRSRGAEMVYDAWSVDIEAAD